MRDAVWHALGAPTCSTHAKEDSFSSADCQTNQDFMNCTAPTGERLGHQKGVELGLWANSCWVGWLVLSVRHRIIGEKGVPIEKNASIR